MVTEQAAPPPSAAADHSASDSQFQNILTRVAIPLTIPSVSVQLPASAGFANPNGDLRKLQTMYPALAPGILHQEHDPGHMNRGPGLYAVSVAPFMESVSGFPSHTLIPFTYNVPMSSENHPQIQQQPPAQQRQEVVRRFQIVMNIDLGLIVKLAAVIYWVKRDGSRQELALLIFLATIIYLFKTGALEPLVQWFSQWMQHSAAPPPQAPRPAVRAENQGRRGNVDVALADGLPGMGNNNELVDDGNGAAGNEQLGEAEGVQGGNRWWGIVTEVKMLVFGFITSLLPGFHHHID